MGALGNVTCRCKSCKIHPRTRLPAPVPCQAPAWPLTCCVKLGEPWPSLSSVLTSEREGARHDDLQDLLVLTLGSMWTAVGVDTGENTGLSSCRVRARPVTRPRCVPNPLTLRAKTGGRSTSEGADGARVRPRPVKTVVLGLDGSGTQGVSEIIQLEWLCVALCGLCDQTLSPIRHLLVPLVTPRNLPTHSFPLAGF